MQFDKETNKLSDRGKFGQISLITGVIGLLLSALGFFVDRSQFMFSWLTSFTYWVSLGFGGLFFVMIHHITGAKWSVVIRRIAENAMVTLPWMVIFIFPVFIGMSDLYEWVEISKHNQTEKHTLLNLDANSAIAAEIEHDTGHHSEKSENLPHAGHGEVHHDREHQAHVDLILKKTGFLNIPFFVIRSLIYFAVWSLLAFLLWKLSLRQDKVGYLPEQGKTFKIISAPGIIAYAFTVTFAGFDWLMSLFPAWYSTIYGLYYFAGGLMSIMAFMAIVLVSLNKRGILDDVISTEHYHDIGKLLFAFMVVWAYFAFSQYLLIWYANIPEETIYYHKRWVGSWKAVSLLIPLGHFVLPFLLLMSRHVKRNLGSLRLFAVWLLIMHWVDLYWNVLPVLHPVSAVPSWMDLTSMLGIGGIFMYIYWLNLSKNALIPVNDPNLKTSMKFVNI